jgi:hypothetical protein
MTDIRIRHDDGHDAECLNRIAVAARFGVAYSVHTKPL